MRISKLSLDGCGARCDRCGTTLATKYQLDREVPKWEIVEIPEKGHMTAKKIYDFCDERCRVIYFRGRKYFQRKLAHKRSNGCHVD